MKIPKRQPVGEDYKNGVEHSEREQSRKSYTVACDDQFSDAREQMRQRQSINERQKCGDMFEGGHLDRVRSRACRKQNTKCSGLTSRPRRSIAASAALPNLPALQKRREPIRAAR